MRALPFALFACLASVVPAQAQIYSWRDANGARVFSDRPRTDGREIVTFTVGSSQAVLATRPAPTRQTGRFDEIIHRHAADSGISPDLIKAVIQVESGFNPAAVSPKGAQGLMQLMPATARELGVLDPFHPEENIRGGVAYLKQLLGQYSQDLRLALAAYNAGPASVAKYGDVPPYRETQAYVQKITSRTADLPVLGRRTPAAAAAGVQMYKWMEMVDGRPVPRYSNIPPTGHVFEPIVVAQGSPRPFDELRVAPSGVEGRAKSRGDLVRPR